MQAFDVYSDNALNVLKPIRGRRFDRVRSVGEKSISPSESVRDSFRCKCSISNSICFNTFRFK